MTFLRQVIKRIGIEGIPTRLRQLVKICQIKAEIVNVSSQRTLTDEQKAIIEGLRLGVGMKM